MNLRDNLLYALANFPGQLHMDEENNSLNRFIEFVELNTYLRYCNSAVGLWEPRRLSLFLHVAHSNRSEVFFSNFYF